jgi:N-acetylglucosaminyldiphosphoundecaprenol N-acetyl-beta-D-mannosaminyltransferase
MSRSQVLGVDCFEGDLATATDAVIARAHTGLGGYACLANVHVIVTAERDPAVGAAVDAAWAVFPDGAPIAWALRRGGASASRVAGPDLLASVLDHGRQTGLRHFLLGSTEPVLQGLERNITKRYPGVQIAGSLAPPPTTENSAAALARVAAAEADIVWVALGAPKQELWAARHAPMLAPALVVGVGAAFDFLSGTKRRAPRWMQDNGLEWLHRLATEPRRLSWRYVSTNTLFLVSLARR